MITVTKQQMIDLGACYSESEWEELSNKIDISGPVKITEVMDHISLKDTLWALWMMGNESMVKRFILNCAERVRHLMKDVRSIKALDIAMEYLNGKKNLKNLDKAYADAARAAYDSAYASCSDKAANYATQAAANAVHVIFLLPAAYASSAAYAHACATIAYATAYAAVAHATDAAVYSTSSYFVEEAWQKNMLMELILKNH